MTPTDIGFRRDYPTYSVSVEQYRLFREQGYVIVKGLLPQEDVQAMNADMDHMLAGQAVTDADLNDPKAFGLKPGDREAWVRGHMLHRLSPLHEYFFLHPRVLDVLAAIIGPDVLALQTQLFFKKPGQSGQGYHQDAYYLATFPDTLCGAWMALTPATQANGCLWFAVGSHHEPIYPDPQGGGASLTTNISDLGTIENASHTDLSINTLSRIVKKYEGRLMPVEVEAGDVLFFGGHLIHWSFSNQSDIPRRTFVSHYCNARSLVRWSREQVWEGEGANYQHILARGDSHLPYAQPKFGTPCAANAPRPEKTFGPAQSMMGKDDGMMGAMPHADGPDPDLSVIRR